MCSIAFDIDRARGLGFGCKIFKFTTEWTCVFSQVGFSKGDRSEVRATAGEIDEATSRAFKLLSQFVLDYPRYRDKVSREHIERNEHTRWLNKH